MWNLMDLLDELPQRAQLAGHAGSMATSFFHFKYVRIKNVSNRFNCMIPSTCLMKRVSSISDFIVTLWAGHHGIHFGVYCSLRKQGKELWT